MKTECLRSFISTHTVSRKPEYGKTCENCMHLSTGTGSRLPWIILPLRDGSVHRSNRQAELEWPCCVEYTHGHILHDCSRTSKDELPIFSAYNHPQNCKGLNRIPHAQESKETPSINEPDVQRSRRFLFSALAKTRYPHAVWAIVQYIAHCALEKAAWRRLIFCLSSIVPTSGAQKVKVHLLSAIQLPCHLRLASIVPINGLNDHFFATEI